MRMRRSLVVVLATLAGALFLGLRPQARFASRIVDPAREHVQLYWKDGHGDVLGNIGALATLLATRQQRMLFAMNGGMYMEDQRPLGLFIEDGDTVRPLIARRKGEGNFYMQPNGVLGLTASGRAFVCTTAACARQRNVRYATQSGPMLLVDGRINALFKQGSANLNIRNGVGIRPNGELVFSISTEPVNFYDFAQFFLDQGCTDALYLDGAISRAYIPEAGIEQRDGRLGVLIAVTSPK